MLGGLPSFDDVPVLANVAVPAGAGCPTAGYRQHLTTALAAFFAAAAAIVLAVQSWEQPDRTAIFGATAGIAATTIYLAGLIERRDRQAWRLELDPIATVAFFLMVVAVLWALA